jgi:hypothetical protein
VNDDGCLLCELEGVLRDRDHEFRDTLRLMNPNVNPAYDYLYAKLVYVDTDLRRVKEREDA